MAVEPRGGRRTKSVAATVFGLRVRNGGRGGGRRPLCPFFAWLDEHAKKEGGREPLMTTQPRALSSSGTPFTPLLVKKCDRGKAFRVSAAAEEEGRKGGGV